MIRLAITTTFLLLSLGIGNALAADRAMIDSNTTLYFDSAQKSQAIRSSETLECRSAGGLGYAISNRLSIDLQCRLMTTEADDIEWGDAKGSVENLTRNLMVGLSYRF